MTSRQDIIHIGIVDDREFDREGMHLILGKQDGIKVVLVAASAAMALELLPAKKPDILLIDLRMPVMDGMELLPIVLEKHPAVKPVIMSHDEHLNLQLAAIKAGARAYLRKDLPLPEMMNILLTVHKKGEYIPPEVAREALDKLSSASRQVLRTGDFAQFTDMEWQYYQLFLQGLPDKEIADRLGRGSSSVKTYKKSVKEKTGQATEAGLYRWAEERGMLTASPASKDKN